MKLENLINHGQFMNNGIWDNVLLIGDPDTMKKMSKVLHKAAEKMMDDITIAHIVTNEAYVELGDAPADFTIAITKIVDEAVDVTHPGVGEVEAMAIKMAMFVALSENLLKMSNKNSKMSKFMHRMYNEEKLTAKEITYIVTREEESSAASDAANKKVKKLWEKEHVNIDKVKAIRDLLTPKGDLEVN